MSSVPSPGAMPLLASSPSSLPLSTIVAATAAGVAAAMAHAVGLQTGGQTSGPPIEQPTAQPAAPAEAGAATADPVTLSTLQALSQIGQELDQVATMLGCMLGLGAIGSMNGFSSIGRSAPPVPPSASRASGASKAAAGVTGDAAQKFDKYGAMLSPKAKGELAKGKRVVLALRQDTAPSANGGHGLYNDRVVVMWQDAQGKHVEELRANTQPSAQYGAGGEKASRGRADLGRLSEGAYTYTQQAGSHVGNTFFESADKQETDRYTPGQYGAARPTTHDAGGAAGSMLIHQGGEGNTWSAGCQTMPPAEYERFKSLVSGQGSFVYDLHNVTA